MKPKFFYNKDAFEKEVQRIVADREYNQKETEIMIQKEKEAKLVSGGKPSL